MIRKLFSSMPVLSFFAHIFSFATKKVAVKEAHQDMLGGVDKATYLADIATQLKLKWPKNRIINIVCHGHSVPAGYFNTPLVDTFNAYPHLLHRALKQRFPYAVINVIVSGIGGETSEQGVKRFAQDALAHNPDLITIDYALNDRRIGLEKAKEAWAEMIEAATTKGIKVILLTPTGDMFAQMGNPKDPLNQHAAQICTLAIQYEVALADSLGAFKDYMADKGKLSDLMSQVNHPNRQGHELVVEKLLEWFPS